MNNTTEHEKFLFFWNGPFSQWHPSMFTLDGVTYANAEQYMMYQKALLFKDMISSQKILATNNPKDVKALGRNVKNFSEHLWDEEKVNIVHRGTKAKFTQNPHLLQVLINTRGKTLVEASPYDSIWGIGLSENDPRVLQRSTWLGKNLLGEILTRVRDEIILASSEERCR